MNRKFHYYVVKYLAEVTGMKKEYAQLTAEFSQFIDDSIVYDTNYQYNKVDVPKEILNRGLYEEGDNDKLIIPIPKTALYKYTNADLEDSNKLEEYKKVYQDKSNQMECLVPFHYYPQTQISIDGNEKYYVHPIDSFTYNKQFSALIQKSISEYQQTCKKSMDLVYPACVLTGILTHVIADSYAHSYLNGFENYINDTKILQVQDAYTYQKLTDQYPILTDKRLHVGHECLSTTVDDFGISLVYGQAKQEKAEIWPQTHSVDTSSNFLKASYTIYKYLLMVTGEKDEGNQLWKNIYSLVLKELFMMRDKSEEDMCAWLTDRTEMTYKYDSDSVRVSMVKNVNNISSFAIAVDDVRKSAVAQSKQVIQNTIIKEDNMEYKVTFSPLVMVDDEFTITIKALYGKIEPGMVMSVVMYNKKNSQQIFSDTYIAHDKNQIVAEFTRKLPPKESLYLVCVTVYNKEQAEIIPTISQEYIIEDTTSYITMTQLIEKSCNRQMTEPFMYITNNYISQDADYSYLDNAPYVNQNNISVLDLVAPISVLLNAKDGITIEQINSYQLTMSDESNNTYRHCGSFQFNQVLICEKRKNVEVRFNEHWKNQITCTNYLTGHERFDLHLDMELVVRFEANEKQEGTRTILFSSDVGMNGFLPVLLSFKEYLAPDCYK